MAFASLLSLCVLAVILSPTLAASVIDCRADNVSGYSSIEISNQVGGPIKIEAAQNDHVGYIVCKDGLQAGSVDHLLVDNNTTYILFAFKAPHSGEAELWPKPGIGFPASFNVTQASMPNNTQTSQDVPVYCMKDPSKSPPYYCHAPPLPSSCKVDQDCVTPWYNSFCMNDPSKTAPYECKLELPPTCTTDKDCQRT
eukprot:TRINITY_DN866_c0_g2_i1.p1 TRINITY_DN866_c0_g2~~TRINITY_DN866_c0_g2_i1.p1  ORF type:complete len:197 (-),score=46.23 TRINITY_DN866_c0_g2_i1:188-778(-)